MKLDAWLEQDHSLDERLRVIECLCQAVNEVHDQGQALGALEPGRVEVSPGRRCDLSAAVSGSPSPAYTAPDHESGIPTATADVYAAGVIAWEILAGRSAGQSPRHLAEVRPDLSRELADAVMACLEGSAEWRPNDLTYLAQMAAARQSNAGRATPDTSRAPLPPRPAPPRTSSRRPSRRTWPLLAALVVLLGLAAFEWKDYLGIGLAPERKTPPAPLAPAATAPPATEPPSSPPTTAAETDEEPGPPVAAPDAAPIPPPSEAGPAGRREAPPVTAPVSLPPASLPPAAPVTPPTRGVPAEPAPPPAQTAVPEGVAPPEPAVPPVTATPEDAAPEPATGAPPSPPESRVGATPSTPAPTVEPAVLEAVSPLEVKRPGKVLLDLRGQRFQPRHRVRVVAVKKVPWGIKIVREKRVSEALITVLVELSAEVEPGDYAFAVEDGLGTRSDPVVFKVTK